MEEIQLIPDFENLTRAFARDARNYAKGMAGHLPGTVEQKLETMRFIQGLTASLNICTQAVDSAKAVEALRDLMAEVTQEIVTQADALDNQINAETCAVCGKRGCDEPYSTVFW